MCSCVYQSDLPFIVQNLEVWLEAKKEIDKIEPHPNQTLPDTDEGAGPSSAGPSTFSNGIQ